ncbi:hypothetical protein [Bradyrhizobium embrapense]
MLAFQKLHAIAASHNRQSPKFILFEQFQIGLPPAGNRIIVSATVAYPVGDSHDPTVSCRRKRLPTPEGERDAKSQYQRAEYVRRSGQ